jgi:general secretion pathway protein F
MWTWRSAFFFVSCESVDLLVTAFDRLDDAMREQPTVFAPLSIHMVEVGENSGTLDAVLDQLANLCERYLQLKDRVTNALFYPVVVLSLSCCVGLFLMTVVVPMLLDKLLEAGKQLPWPTQIPKTTRDFVRGHWFEFHALRN